MNRRRFIAAFLALSFAIGMIEVAAVRLNLYFELPWLDTVMHFLGGIWIAAIVLIVISFARGGALPSSRAFLLSVLFTILAVAVLWELLELAMGLNQVPAQEYWPDTVGDVITGTFGALSGAFTMSRRYSLS